MWTGSEGTSFSEQCEHNVESLALSVMARDQSGEHILLFLEDWELAKALSCHIALSRKCTRPGSWAVAAKRLSVTARKPSLTVDGL